MDNFFTRLFRREAQQTIESSARVEQVVISERTAAVEVATPLQAMQITTVQACVEKLASTVAKLPLEYKRRNSAKGIFVDYTEDTLFYLLSRRPSRYQSAYEFWFSVVAQMKLLGNAYAYIQRLGSGVEQIILLSPNTCAYNELTDTYSVTDFTHGVRGVFAPENILHFSNGSISGGRVGISTIAYAAQTLSIQATADAETRERFASGGKIKALFTNDTSVRGFGQYTNQALAAEARKIENQLASGRSIVAVEGDGKLHQLNMTSADLQFLESRKYGVREICRAFGVPPSKIYEEFNHAYNAGETAGVEFLTDSIDPILTKLEQELEIKLLGDAPAIANNYRIIFDREKMFTVNSITKADYLTKMLAVGAYSVNDIRRKENMQAVEGGDMPLVSCNVAPINSAKITGEEKNLGNQNQ